MKQLKKDIKKYKDNLIKKARKKGLYENFGDTEHRKLKDKHIDSSVYNEEMNAKRDLIKDFWDWTCNCDINTVKNY